MADNSVPTLAADRITKTFGSLVANDSVSVAAHAGRVLAIVGENGAGKSTLMNVMSGMLQPDEGRILMDGRPVRFHSPREAIRAGIGMVHQHFMLIPVFTVAENVVLGQEPRSRILYNARRANRRVGELSERFGLKLNPTDRVRDLPVGIQQRVEIVKLLFRGSNILIFDEPTAVLTPQETKELFVVLRDLAVEGRTIIFITHKLHEVMAISDHITVLRLGKVVGDLDTSQSSPHEITRYMIGRDLMPSVRKSSPKLGEPAVEMTDVRCQSDRGLEALRGVTLEVRAGEILGIAGVEGNGQSELVEVLTGLRPSTSGTVRVRDRQGKMASTHRRSPRRIRELGVAYIPEDRRARGLILRYSVADNLIFGIQDRRPYSSFGVLKPREIKNNARELIPEFDIRPRRFDVPVGTLSGGNQQKVVLAREFSENPTVLIASQPTRGLDVGAAQFVHEGLVAKRDQGVAVLLISAELDEIMTLADRIIVIYEGEIMGVFEAGSVDENRLGLLMTGGEEKTAAQSIDLTAAGLSAGHNDE